MAISVPGQASISWDKGRGCADVMARVLVHTARAVAGTPITS